MLYTKNCDRDLMTSPNTLELHGKFPLEFYKAPEIGALIF